jgi:hypothetical protein
MPFREALDTSAGHFYLTRPLVRERREICPPLLFSRGLFEATPISFSRRVGESARGTERAS